MTAEFAQARKPSVWHRAFGRRKIGRADDLPDEDEALEAWQLEEPRKEPVQFNLRHDGIISPLQGRLLARAYELYMEQTALVEVLNENMPDGALVRPWAMVPQIIFMDELANFLMLALDFYPACMNNTMLLAADKRSADILGIPEHPGAAPRSIEEEALLTLREVRDAFADEHSRVGEALASGDITTLMHRAARKKEYTDSVCLIAQGLCENMFGPRAMSRHHRHFAHILRWQAA